MKFRLSTESLDWALAHIEVYGDTDIFPRPFEYEAIRLSWKDVRAFLRNQDFDEWNTRSLRTCLSPKGRFAYRIATQLDPLDAIAYLALTYEIGEKLEAYRVPRDDDVVFSYRFAPTPEGQMFDPTLGWSKFNRTCEKRAQSASVGFVVVADISDFFHRIYHHRVDNTLAAATKSNEQSRALFKLISQWRGTPSFGIPVGPAPSRLIAEVVLDDVDKSLLAARTSFCRYSDDYRIFCRHRRDAYDKLALLANLLHQNHGLTLQPGKTKIVPADEFLHSKLGSPESKELTNLEEKFKELLEALELEDRYDDIDYDDLDADKQKLVDGLNLEDLLKQELAKEEVDVGVMRFILRRLGQLADASPALRLLRRPLRLYPVVDSVVQYLSQIMLSKASRRKIGEMLVDLIKSSSSGHLAYHRYWLLSLFANENGWGQDKKLRNLYDSHNDSFTRRELVLAFGRTGHDYWFRSRLNEVLNLEPWERRAFLAAASCLPADERKYWYGSLRPRLDPAEAAVVAWAKQAPF